MTATLTQEQIQIIEDCDLGIAEFHAMQPLIASTLRAQAAEINRLRDEARNVAAARVFSANLYERAYLAALTGLLASGNYDVYGASVDAHDCATRAVAAIERAAGGEG